MADVPTSTYTAQQSKNTSLHVHPSFRSLQQPIRYAVFPHTLLGTEANTNQLLLGSLGIDGAKIIPDLSVIADTGGTGDVDFDGLLGVRDADDSTETALSVAASVDNNTVPFVNAAAGTLVAIAANDILYLTLSNVEAVTAGETIEVRVAYITENNVA